jgi:hypothetical protein
MRPTFQRALAGAATTATLCAGLLATPALAGSTFCVHDDSTRLFTANDGTYKLWVETRTVDGYRETHVCFGAGDTLRGEYSFRDGLGGTFVPTVEPLVDDPACPRLLHVQDPVDVMTRFAQQISTNPYYVCFGLVDQAVRITLGTPSPTASPDTDLHLDRDTEVADAICAAVPTIAGCSGGTELNLL